MNDNNDIKMKDILEETINLSILNKLLKNNLITEKQYYILKKKIKTF